MKKTIMVDIIRPGSINAIIGPVGTLKRVVRNRPFFLARGYDITVFSNDGQMREAADIPSAPIANSAAPKGVLYRMKIWMRKLARHSYLLGRFYMNKSYLATKQLIAKYVDLGRTPDIIQFHSDLECYLYLKMRKEDRAKIVMFLHSDGIPYEMECQYFPKLRGTRYINRMINNQKWTSSQVDQCVFIANIGRVNYLRYFPDFDASKSCVILNGIDNYTDAQNTEISAIRSGLQDSPFKYRLCCSGTMNSRKGHRIIIEALHLISEKQRMKIHVDFFGEGPDRPVLEEAVSKYHLEDHISFFGAIPNIEIYRYLSRENIYILMSKNEGLPISIIEALRAGLPVISTKVSGIPELVREEYNGLLIDPDVDQLVEILENIDSYNWEEMGRHSALRFENEFTFDRMQNQICDMYDKITS